MAASVPLSTNRMGQASHWCVAHRQIAALESRLGRYQFTNDSAGIERRANLSVEVASKHRSITIDPKPFLSGAGSVTGGPPLSLHVRRKLGFPPMPSFAHSTSTLPPSESAPCFVALVASSWRATVSANACFG